MSPVSSLALAVPIPSVNNVKEWADKKALFEPEEATYSDSGTALETTDNDGLGWTAVHPS